MSTLGARVWPWVPVGLLAAMLTGLGTMAAIAVNDPGFALEKNYYAKAVAYDRVIAQRAENERLGWSIDAELDAPAPGAATPLVVRLRHRGGPVAGARGSVEAFSNANAGNVIETRFEEVEAGVYRASLPVRRGGLWEFRLAFERGSERFTATERRDVPEPRP
ncbi:MAG TPA: FixH family protein [Polyangiaceae bacterium]